MDWEFATRLFDATTVAALAGAYLRLLAAFTAARPGRFVVSLPLGSAPAPVAHHVPGTPVPVRIARQALATPDAVAIHAGRTELTYRELHTRARALAGALRAAGAGPDDTVLLAARRGIGWAVGLLGIWYSGAACVPVDPTTGQRRLNAMVSAAGARHAVTGSAADADALRRRLGGELSWLVADGPAPPTAQAAGPHPDTVAASLAYVLFTSGSTGRPKPVAVGHGSLTHHARVTAQCYGLTSADRVLQFTAPSFDVSFEEAVPTWCTGASTLFVPENTVDASALETELSDGKVTVVNLPTPYWAEWARDLRARPRPLPPRLRLVVVGSDVGHHVDPERWYEGGGGPVVNAYGLTETTITATTCRLPGPDMADADATAALPIGRPLPGVGAYVLDSALQPVPPA